MTNRAPRFLGAIPQFRVPDLVKTAEYYRDTLGFELEEYFGDPPQFTQATRDRAVLQLGQAASSGGTTRAHDGVGYNAYIWVDDVDALAAEYRRRGADIVEGPAERAYSCRELVVRDCNGLRLCFAQDTSQSGAG